MSNTTNLKKEDCKNLGPVDFTPFMTPELKKAVLAELKSFSDLAFSDGYKNIRTINRCVKAGSWSGSVESCVKWQLVRVLHRLGVDVTKIEPVERRTLWASQKQEVLQVISNGNLCEYVGIGWIQLRPATIQDLAEYRIAV